MNVIIAEDDATTRVLLSSLIKKLGHTPITVSDGMAAWNAYRKETEAGLMLIDWEMPELSGIELCQKIKAQDSSNPPYLILVTGRTETADVVRGLEEGADDYVRKPFNASELAARVMVAERTLKLNEELNDTREELRFQATHDQLTGLLNRRAVLEALDKELKRSERQHMDLYVALCDIDNFKAVNDTYGHDLGDRVLQEISAAMLRVFRPYDLVSRYGGEEFLIVLTDPTGSGTQVFERLRQEIASLTVQAPSGLINPTISVGVVALSENRSEQAWLMDNLLKQADDRLYKAKSQGKNRVIDQG